MMGKTAHNRRRRQKNRIRRATQKSEETKADRHASVKKTIAGPSPYSPQYFELQKDGYCQIHALNNAVQEKLLTPSMITKVCQVFKKNYENHCKTPKAHYFGGGSGFWKQSIFFLAARPALLARGYQLMRVCKHLHSVPKLQYRDILIKSIHEIQVQSMEPLILYTRYTESMRQKGKLVLQETAHCVAVRGPYVLDSNLKGKTVHFEDYPYLDATVQVFQLVRTNFSVPRPIPIRCTPIASSRCMKSDKKKKPSIL